MAIGVRISKYSSFVFDEDNHRYDTPQYRYVQPFASKNKLMNCVVGIIRDISTTQGSVGIYDELTGNKVVDFSLRVSGETVRYNYYDEVEMVVMESWMVNPSQLKPYRIYQIRVYREANPRPNDIPIGIARFICYETGDECASNIIELYYDTVNPQFPKDFFLFGLQNGGSWRQKVLFSCVGGINRRASKFHSQVETFRNSEYLLHNIMGFASETDTIVLGDAFGVPNDVGKKLSLILSCAKVEIYHPTDCPTLTPITLSDSADIERLELGDDYPFFCFSANIETWESNFYDAKKKRLP